MSTLSVINIQGQSAATLPVFQDSTGTEYGRLCRAFVNFNGKGSVSTNQSTYGSFNVTSVYKNATGDYTISFTKNMPDTGYCVTCSSQYSNSVTSTRGSFAGPYSNSTTPFSQNSIRIQNTYVDSNQGIYGDSDLISVAIFR